MPVEWQKLIHLKHVSKSFADKVVLAYVSLSLDAGQLITLIGSNGVGKSTLLRLMAGAKHPDQGAVAVFGTDPFDFRRRSDLFLVHENVAMAFPMALEKMIPIYREVYPNWRQAVFDELLRDRRFSLNKQYAELSRGQRIQFLLTLALAARPEVLFLDEITAVIDI
jgi:ABC-2 type transport system ATP-binding protein